MITIRPPQNAQEVRSIETIQQTAWQMDDRAITPYNTLHAWMHAGGIVLGAFDGQAMVGFVASFRGEVDNKPVQWSHIAAVLPNYRRQGIGRQLKFAQRIQALEQGIEIIAWTFDPLRKENAVFNLESLGATCQILHFELYGKMEDGLNKGLLSDRLEIHWQLKSKRVVQRASGKQLPSSNNNPPASYVTRCRKEKPDMELPSQYDRLDYGIEVPSDIESLRLKSTALTHRWYHALRDSAVPLFQAGYYIDRIYLNEEKPEIFTYVLTRDSSWYLYILETADGTLYTGITVDVEKRVAAHNAGQGAKYTLSRRPVKLIAVWETYGRSKATQLEGQLKKLSRQRKLELVETHSDFQTAHRKF